MKALSYIIMCILALSCMGRGNNNGEKKANVPVIMTETFPSMLLGKTELIKKWSLKEEPRSIKYLRRLL